MNWERWRRMRGRNESDGGGVEDGEVKGDRKRLHGGMMEREQGKK